MHHRKALLNTVTEMRDRLNYLAFTVSQEDSEISELLSAAAASVGKIIERIEATESVSLQGDPVLGR